MATYPWRSDDERLRFLAGDTLDSQPALYTGPPPAPPTHVQPSIPAISDLATSIIRSSDKLFFISHGIGTDTAREWRLVRVAFQDSITHYAPCLQDGKFLVEFYIAHRDDSRYNAINRRHWIQYHAIGDISHPNSASDTHHVRPSDTSEAYASSHGLVPFRKWINLTHESVYIHGPFEFATVHRRKTRDRISQTDWDVLTSHKPMFQNKIPSFDLPTYLIHVDRGTHVAYHDSNTSLQLPSIADGATIFNEQDWQQLQKVFATFPAPHL